MRRFFRYFSTRVTAKFIRTDNDVFRLVICRCFAMFKDVESISLEISARVRQNIAKNIVSDFLKRLKK